MYKISLIIHVPVENLMTELSSVNWSQVLHVPQDSLTFIFSLKHRQWLCMLGGSSGRWVFSTEECRWRCQGHAHDLPPGTVWPSPEICHQGRGQVHQGWWHTYSSYSQVRIPIQALNNYCGMVRKFVNTCTYISPENCTLWMHYVVQVAY